MRGYALVLTALCLVGCMTSSEVKTDGLDAAILQVSQEIGRVLTSGSGGPGASSTTTEFDPDEIRKTIKENEDALKKKPVVAVVNVESESPKLSEYVLDRLTAALLEEKKVTVVERKNLELIQQEMNFQLSGEVSDESAGAIGKKLGASSIITASFRKLGEDTYRFVVKTLNVETAEVEVFKEAQIPAQELGVFFGKPAKTKPPKEPKDKSKSKSDRKSGSKNTQKNSESNPSKPSKAFQTKIQDLQNNGFRILSLVELASFIPKSGDDIAIIIEAHESLGSTHLYFNGTPVRITLFSDSANIKKLSIQGIGSLFTVGKGVTLILEDIALQGVKENTHSLITVEEGGALVMNQGASITGNAVFSSSSGGGGGVSVLGDFTMNDGTISGNAATADPGGGGVYITNGTFIMNGGTINDNVAYAFNTSISASSPNVTSISYSASGGGVYVGDGIFTMSGGTISDNSSPYGGGVYVTNGTFTMSDGTISGNAASSRGGGVYIADGTFTMSGGKINRNAASSESSFSDGGGVYVTNGTFTMSGGTISDNAASSTLPKSDNSSYSSGGGVYVKGTFIMNDGTITYNAASSNSSSSGGGVYVKGNFTMSKGTIRRNSIESSSSSSSSSYSSGGGVFVTDGNFTMNGGTISGNSASSYNYSSSSYSSGGGVSVTGGNFTMNDGTITYNSASSSSSYGGGVYVKGNFTMSKGTISSNSASSYGGGVYVEGGTFQKGASGGTIYGSNLNTDLKNTAQSGAAVYVNKGNVTKKRESTLNAAVALDSEKPENWE